MIIVEPREVQSFVELAVDRMMSKAAALGTQISDRPDIEGANSVFSLVVHCLEVADWWLDHVVLGNPSARDREGEFESAGPLSELEDRVEVFRTRLPELLDRVAVTPEPAATETATGTSQTWPWTTGSIVLHVVEELFQHAGHVDITADLIAARPRGDT